MIINNTLIYWVLIIGFLFLLSAFIQIKFPSTYNKIIVWYNFEDEVIFKASIISKVIISSLFFIYSLFIYNFPKLEHVSIIILLVALYSIYTGVIILLLRKLNKTIYKWSF